MDSRSEFYALSNEIKKEIGLFHRGFFDIVYSISFMQSKVGLIFNTLHTESARIVSDSRRSHLRYGRAPVRSIIDLLYSRFDVTENNKGKMNARVASMVIGLLQLTNSMT